IIPATPEFGGVPAGARSAREALEDVAEHRRSGLALRPCDDEVLAADHLGPEIERDVLHLPLCPVPAERLQFALVHGGTVDAHAEALVRDATWLERLGRIDRLQPTLPVLHREPVHRALRDRAVEEPVEA